MSIMKEEKGGTSLSETILIVDDEIDLLHGLKRTVAMDMACRVLTAENGPQALELIEREPVDVVLADIRMPGMDGIQLLQEIRNVDPAVTVIIMTAYGTIERAVEAIKSGAYDFIQKPIEEERLFHLLKKGLELNRLVRENARLTARLCERQPFENMVGTSRPMRHVFHTIQMLAKTDVNVLILGDTGTGKDMAAKAIHSASSRRSNSLVTVNCPALPESILESELFGYKKGAFTNADSDKKGLFDQAQQGTIFLDEIGDLNPSVQTKLLRVLQDKRITPLGATESFEVDVRIIAATNRNLEEKMRAGEFREDLFYRLNVAVLTMPGLSDIRDDIPLLVNHFLKKIACENNTEPKALSPEIMNFLMDRDWPGNIRELENTLRGWCALTASPVITTDILAPAEQSAGIDKGTNQIDFSKPYKQLKAGIIDKFTLNYLHNLLEHTSGNVSASAHISGIKRQSLQKIIRRYRVDVDRYRQ